MDRDRIRVFCGRSNPELAKEICACLDVPLGQSIVSDFSDGEIRLQILENVRERMFSQYSPPAILWRRA